jgi:vanillate O-demethylase ferredoxin subunit
MNTLAESARSAPPAVALLPVRVARRRMEADGICSFELVADDGGALPAFSAGAHIDVHLPGGPVRQYSLCNSPAERHRYLIQRHARARGRRRPAADRRAAQSLCTG